MGFLSKFNGILNGELKISDRRKYNILSVSIAAVHVGLTFIFWYIGSVPMTIYNCFSVAGYLFCLYLIKKNRLGWVYMYICIEVPLHSLLATYAAGWEFGFALYLVAIVPVGFEMSFALKNTVRGIKASIMFGLLNLAAFISCRLYSYENKPFYSINNQSFVRTVYICNVLCTFVLLLIYSFIFVAEINAVHLDLKRKNAELAKLASKDTLTGLYNRRVMHEYLNDAAKNGHFSIIMSDIDNFKHVNDTYGHDCGDEVLKMAAEIVGYCMPEGGCVCRWGGEEFLMLTDRPLAEAADIAEKIRAAVESKHISYNGKDISVTLTLGVSEYSGSATVDKTITAADKNLYRGKNSGKNCVIV